MQVPDWLAKVRTMASPSWWAGRWAAPSPAARAWVPWPPAWWATPASVAAPTITAATPTASRIVNILLWTSVRGAHDGRSAPNPGQSARSGGAVAGADAAGAGGGRPQTGGDVVGDEGVADLRLGHGAGEDDAEDGAVGVDQRAAGVAGADRGLELVDRPGGDPFPVDVPADGDEGAPHGGGDGPEGSAAGVAERRPGRPGGRQAAGQGEDRPGQTVGPQHGHVEPGVEEDGGGGVAATAVLDHGPVASGL